MTCNTLYPDGTGISGHSPTPRRESIESLAKHIRLLVLDVDGVMTDGGLYYDANGLVMKRFHVLDGIGIPVILAAYIIAVALRLAQGSAKVALTTTASLMASGVMAGDFSALQAIAIPPATAAGSELA